MFGEQVFVSLGGKSEQVFGRTSVRIRDPRSPELFENMNIGGGGAHTIFTVGLLWIDLSKREGDGCIFFNLRRWWKGIRSTRFSYVFLLLGASNRFVPGFGDDPDE